MSEIKRTFLQGKMQKDLDERIIPDGQYLDALNVQVAKSEGGDVGAVENSLGNIQKTQHNLTNAKCIGAHADHSNQLIYYFVTADEKDFIAEYNDASQSTVMLLESTRVNGVTLLNFKKDKLITGVAKIISGTRDNDLLTWTDDNEQPRIINIERAKEYGVDGFVEDDISLIKKPPIFAPDINLTYVSQGNESNINDKFLSFAYAYRYLDGEMSALSPFTTAAFSPNQFKLDYQTFENEGMQNIFSAVDINFNTGSKRVTDVVLVFKESNSNTIYVVETFNKKDSEWQDNEVREFRFSNSKIYRVMDENELFRLFDNVPRKAKALDLIGNRIALGNYLEGYDLKDSFGERLKIDYYLSLFTKNLEGSAVTHELLTLNVANDLISIDLTGITLTKNTRLRFGIELAEKDGGTGTYTGDFDYVINQDFDSVSDLATDPDFVLFIEEVLTAGFLSDYTNTPPADSTLTDNGTFLIDSFTPTSVTLYAPSLIYTIDNTPLDGADSNFSTETRRWGFNPSTEIAFKDSATDSSCKTNRSYEAAIVYLDEYGRATTALTAPENTLFIPQVNSVFQNKIRVNVNHKPPAWAKYFRFALKQNKKEYQTIYATIFYEEGLFRWVKLDGGNKDKVSEGDTLIVKADLNGPVSEPIKVRVLEVSTKPVNFLVGNLDPENNEINEAAGLYMKIKPGSDFDMNYDGDTFKTIEAPLNREGSGTAAITFSLSEKNADGLYEDIAISAGTTIVISFRNWRNRTAQSDLEVTYKGEWIANKDYINFQEFFETQVNSIGSESEGTFFNRYPDNRLELVIYGSISASGFNKSKMGGSINFQFTEGVVIFETEPEDALDAIYYEGNQTFNIVNGETHEGNIQNQTLLQPAIIELDFFNCYSFGNGVESYRYNDALNAKYLNIDTRPTAKSESEYREIRRYADITYGAAYIESLGINGLNNFNLSTGNYKDDVVKKYGYIQKIIARDTDLLLFQEDKVSRVLYGKELVVGPDGGSNLASVPEILGTQVMYAGEHGVSRNPESIAMAGTRIWWSDEKRNQVCRLSLDGVTVISEYGMTSYFRELFTDSMNRMKLGAYDPYHGKYVLSADDQLIYNPLSKIDCSQSLTKQNFNGEMEAEVDFGIFTGEVGINIVTDKPVTVKLIWNNVLYSEIITASGSVLFTKSQLLPRFASLTVTATEPTSFTVSGQCAIVEKITVISIVRGNAADAGTILTNRYKWISGNYAGPYKNFRETFIKDGGVTLYNSEEGDEGSGFIPKTGSTILLESYKGFGDTASFGTDDVIGYLVSNTLYAPADVETLVGLAATTSPEPQITEGGETINGISFDFLRPANEKYLYLLWDYSSLSININTYIFIYFDSSGSMNSTLTPLITMRDTVLKDALLPLYENNEAEYNAKVQVVSHSSERTLHMLNFLDGIPPEGNVISLVFQDEANSTYHGSDAWSITDVRTTQYNLDIATLRSRLNGFASNYYRGIVFQVETGPTGIYGAFQRLMPAIQTGAGQYSGSNGLSDRNEFNYKYNVTPGATPEFYKDTIVNALRELGYNL